GNVLHVDQLHVTENATTNNLKATTVVSENLSMGKLAYVDRQQGLTNRRPVPNVMRLRAWLDQFQRYATQVSSMMQQRQQQQQQQRGQVAPGTIPGRRPASGLETPQEAAPEASPPADPAPSGTSAAGEGGAAPNSEEQG